MLKIIGWSKMANGRMRVEFLDGGGRRCVAIVQPTQVVLRGKRMLIEIEQDTATCPPVTRWNADGTVDVAADLSKRQRSA
jgi:hypothetical protein